jgi:oxazoline/thiazoline synthase
MIAQPIFRPHIRPVALPGMGVLLLTEKGHRLLEGRLCEALLPLVDGRRTADEIVEALHPDFPATHVYYALLMLENKGYLTESHQQVQHANAGFWSLYGLDARHVECKLAATTVSIKTLSAHVSKELLTDALTAVGVRIGNEGEFTVALVDDYLDAGLKKINFGAIATGRSWILAKPTGSNPWIGPLFSPPKSGCWECLAYRLREHRDFERFLLKGDEACISVPACDTLLTRQITYDILAMEILKWIASEQQCGVCGTVLSIDTRNWQTETHVLVRRPQCPACGTDSYRTELEPVPIKLGHRRFRCTTDGGYRCYTPEETMRHYAYHVSPITGAVRTLYRHPHATNVTKAYVAVSDLVAWEGSRAVYARRIYSSGKGMTEMQAKASALCEALERYSGVYRGYEPSVVSTLRTLGHAAIHPNSCMLYSDEQYRFRAERNSHASKYKIVPEPLDETMEIRWSPVWSLSRKEFRFLPTSYCYFGYSDHPGASRDIGFCYACSNGNAAGNTLEEAILQGLFELVERDSVGIWWYNSLRRPEVELSTFFEPYFGELQEQYQEAGRRIWVLDITADLEIPAFAAISSKLDGGGPILLGFGCHLDARLAVGRALMEANQMLLTASSLEANSDTSFAAVDEETTNWMKTVSLANHPHVVPDQAAPRRTAAEYRQWRNRDICDAVLECQINIEKHGLEMLVLDQTRPDIGIAVVKVIVPGLRHFWARFAPGRLYDVPVKMGWLAAPRREEELNRIATCF